MDVPAWWRSSHPWQIGDCLSIMKMMPDECVDFILTDPPFNVGIDYGTTTNDKMTDKQYELWFLERLKEMERILKPRKTIIIFTGDNGAHAIWNAIEATGLTFQHFIKWAKPNNQTILRGFSLWNRTELGFLCTKGKADWNTLDRKAVYSDTIEEYATSVKGGDDINPVDHPCRRPARLYEKIIRGFSLPNDIIFDPFLGSGTLLLGAKLSGRNGLGCEINPEFEKLIRNRLGEQHADILSYADDQKS